MLFRLLSFILCYFWVLKECSFVSFLLLRDVAFFIVSAMRRSIENSYQQEYYSNFWKKMISIKPYIDSAQLQDIDVSRCDNFWLLSALFCMPVLNSLYTRSWQYMMHFLLVLIVFWPLPFDFFMSVVLMINQRSTINQLYLLVIVHACHM